MAAMETSELPVAPGEVIAGRYTISNVIGSGGMGVVLAGMHLELGERVAIKFLHRQHAALSNRFFREARAAARIRSEHVVRIFDVGRLPSGEPYIVMEYLEGEDLGARLIKMGPMEPRWVVDVVLDVCQALAEAHAAGIVHRDLKPANIFLTKSPGRDDLVKLLDFGVAKVPESGAITKTASLLGSPVYMSPEQLMAARDVDARADIWSLGVILWELLTGKLPFEGDSLVHLAIVIRERPTPQIRDERPDVPEALEAVITRCLAKDRNDRFRDVGEFAVALAPFASPALSLSISRIQRVLADARRQAPTELAATLPPSSDELAFPHIPRTPSTPSRSSPSLEIASETPLLGGSMAALSASAHNPLVDARRRRLRLVGGGLAFAVMIGLLLVVRQTMRPPSVEAKPDPRPSSGAEVATAPSTIATALSSSPLAVEPTASVTRTPDTSPIAPSARTTAHGPAPKKLSSPTASAPAESAPVPALTAAPSVNCNPPFTIDKDGVRRPKKECL